MVFRTFFIVLALVVLSFGAELNWQTSYEQAKIEAKKQNKLVMLFFTMDGCPACEYVKDVVFENHDVIEYLSHYFVLLSRDVKNPSHNIDGFDVYGTPTIYVVKPDGTKVGRQLVGAAPAKVFIEKMREYKKLAK